MMAKGVGTWTTGMVPGHSMQHLPAAKPGMLCSMLHELKPGWASHRLA